jgi:nitronate monooxygenase
VPRVGEAVDVPVVATGGIVAALSLGAHGVQLGTAFLACPESSAGPAYKEAVLAARGGGEPTVLTTAFSGRLARALANRFTDEASRAPLLPYPWQNALTGELRQAAARGGGQDLLSLWVGQGGVRESRPARPPARARPRRRGACGHRAVGAGLTSRARSLSGAPASGGRRTEGV